MLHFSASSIHALYTYTHLFRQTQNKVYHSQNMLRLISNPMFLLIGFLLCFSFPVINGQFTAPTKLDGFWYLNRLPKIDSILIEAFFDPVCPDSRDAWEPLKQAVHHYGSRISLVVHTFPLPYHDNAFPCSRALHIVDKLNTSATYPLMEAFFGQQEKFYGIATFNLSRKSVTDLVIKFAAETVGSSYLSDIKQGFNDSGTDQATRFAFKYGCLRGVYGTPYFFANGFPLPDAGSPLDYKKWRSIIDPLVTQPNHTAAAARHFF